MGKLSKKLQNEITDKIIAYYLGSRDFNGLPLVSLREEYSLPKFKIKTLIESGNIELHFGYGHPNPHVRALPLGDREAQYKMLEGISKEDLAYAVLYPTRQHLEKVVDKVGYENRPYSLMIALGTPTLEYQCFDPPILKNYRDDPRYT